jgi:hypothetical protein
MIESLSGFYFGGRERIRTAVRAFAELCLATRPPDPNHVIWVCKGNRISDNLKIN